MSGAPPIAFAAVNRPGRPGYTAGLQRHHLIPCSLPERRCFAPLFAALPPAEAGLDDFRRNGMLLPASEVAAVRMGLPLHRGPHRDYTAMVAERLGGIEAAWSARHAGEEALAALAAMPGVEAAVWLPARVAMGTRYFIDAAQAWLGGGAFPALGLTALVDASDGGVESHGLAFFVGRELQVAPWPGASGAAVAKLVVRAVHALTAGTTAPARLTGPDGEALSFAVEGDALKLRRID